MKMIYPYNEWECYRAGMYADTDPGPAVWQDVQDLFADRDRLREAMATCLDAWPMSAESNLTDLNGNRKSWLGQAAAAFRCGAPAKVTRAVWGSLTNSQCIRANSAAEEIIAEWDANRERGWHAETLFS